MTANLGHSNQLRQRQAQFNEQCKNGSAAPAPKPQQAAPAAPDDSSKFPFDVLPLRAQEFVSGAKIANGVPSEYLAAALLWTAATAAGNAAKLEVKPGVIETAVFFLGIVGPPNAAKSPALRLALRPLHDANKAAFNEFRRQEAAYKADKESADEPEPLSKVLLSDSTPEAMFSAHFNRLQGIGIHRDELAGWIKSFDRYNSGGEMDTWLSIWSAEPASIDRKTTAPVLIDRPFIGVIGGIQPGRLEGIASDDKAAAGFLDRFLFTWPDDLKKPEWSLNGLDSSHTEHWSEAITKLLALPFGGGDRVITMTETAQKKLFDHFNRKNKPRCDSAKSERLAGMYGKFDLHCIRLTLALHLLRFAYSGDALPGGIDAATVADGIRISEYFVTQSERVHAQIFDSSAADKLPRDVRQWYDRLVKSLNEKKTTIATADAVTAGEIEGLSESKVKRFLGRKDLFDKIRHGEYIPIL